MSDDSSATSEGDRPDGDRTDVGIVDGRRARGVRSREAVLDAVLDLYREGVHRPSVELVADRAGVSRRSIFRHFDDLQAMSVAAIDRHLERLGPFVEPPSVEGDVERRARALARQRARLYEEITPVRVVTQRLRGRVDIIDDRLARAHRLLRRQIESLFAAELSAMSEADRAEVLDGLDAAVSWEVWNVLRSDQGASVAHAERVLARTVAALVTGR